MDHRTLLVCSAGFAVALAGCTSEDRLTLDNYYRVQKGMTPAEVRDILGEPEEDHGGGISIGRLDLSGRVMVWEEDDRVVEATFTHEKLVQKSQKGLE